MLEINSKTLRIPILNNSIQNEQCMWLFEFPMRNLFGNSAEFELLRVENVSKALAGLRCTARFALAVDSFLHYLFLTLLFVRGLFAAVSIRIDLLFLLLWHQVRIEIVPHSISVTGALLRA